MKKVSIDIKSNKCNYPQCIHYESGRCLNLIERRNCMEIALAVFCLNEELLNESGFETGVCCHGSEFKD